MNLKGILEIAKKYAGTEAEVIKEKAKSEDVKESVMNFIAETAKKLNSYEKEQFGKEVSKEIANTIIFDVTQRRESLSLDFAFDVKRASFGDDMRFEETYPFSCTKVSPGGSSIIQEQKVVSAELAPSQLDVLVAVPIRRVLAGTVSLDEIASDMRRAIDAKAWVLGLDALIASCTDGTHAVSSDTTAAGLKAAIDGAINTVNGQGDRIKSIIGFAGKLDKITEVTSYSDQTKFIIENGGGLGTYKGYQLVRIMNDIDYKGSAYFASTYVNKVFVIPDRKIYAGIKGEVQMASQNDIFEDKYYMKAYMDLGFLCYSNRAVKITIS